MPADPALASAILTIDLSAIVANWQRIRRGSQARDVAAVVKADAYGLGVEQIVPALHAAGCRHFFTAHLSEGLELLPLLPKGSFIAVLNGLNPGTAPASYLSSTVPDRPGAGSGKRSGVASACPPSFRWTAACRVLA